MIDNNNFGEALLEMGFIPGGGYYEKKYPATGAVMRAYLGTKKLVYPEQIRGRERNTGFDQPENFVVFECVDRLLTKGYRPEDIELEKEWHLGHDSKSGRADICVSDPTGSMLFIVECKTWGKEFEKALKDTKNDGAQLFSYWQQEQSSKWLVLYSSNVVDGKIEYKAPTINCSDDANIILLAKQDKTIKLFTNAHTTTEKYEAWKETYLKQIHDDLIFSDDSVAYNIGVRPLLKKDLLDFKPEDKIVNQFEEILRHNNVSDKENAFNRLIALFICKLVDESTKNEDDEVEFQYKQGTDTYETLQDRLQRLHRDGMEKFMREKIFYVSSEYPEWLFKTYTGSQRKKAIEDLQNTIRILKFYSNNDFAFKDVHNEELFYQNGKILVEMVQLFEKYRIVYPSKHQFLGDLFEQLLNKGFKQNEGQFFTPMPITRFIWDSLPLERLVSSERGTVYPKVIDYACGAGHFLTEAIEAINYYAKTDGNNDWVRDHIFGVEKDYRLARVAKISLFMNGAGEGNIIFGDGLENAPDKQIENGTFDILVANPPYSVKDFKQHLQLKNNGFELLDKIGINGSEIETLFVERIAQLLKPKGIAAVVLPSSILSNDSASYTGAREHLLKNFYIRGIVSFGSKTFGATGTNTVVVFLEKFNEPPKLMDMATDAVDAIINGREFSEWKDKEILGEYINQIELEADKYEKFIDKEFSLDELIDIDYFKMYCDAFSSSAEVKKYVKTKAYKTLSEDKQKTAYLEKLYNFIRGIEAEKLYYFYLVYNQSTVIIKSPVDNNEQKKFLGYDWSNRKGNEGIQINTPGGKMYDDNNREKEGTLAHALRQSFLGTVPNFKESQTEYGSLVATKDMLDFSRVSFNKALRLSIEARIELVSKYPISNLIDIADVVSGQSPKSEYYNDSGIGLPFYQGKKEFGIKELLAPSVWTSYTTKESINGDILMSVRAPVGDININPFEKICIGRGLAAIRSKTESVTQEYLYCFLRANQENISGHDGLAFDSISSDEVKSIKVPVPPIGIQKQIVSECEKIEEEYNTTRMSVENYHKKIEDLFNELEVISNRGGYRLSSLFDWVSDKIKGNTIATNQYVTTDTMLQNCEGITEYEGVVPNTVTAFKEKDILLSNIRPYLQKLWYATFDGGCSNDVLVMRIKDESICNPKFYAAYLKRSSFFEYIMQDVSGTKMPRGKKPHILNCPVIKPDITIQNEVVAKVSELERKICEEERKLEAIQDKLESIIKQYLY